MSNPGQPSERFLSAVGALTINWAVVEALLDFSIAIIFHDHPYDKMDNELPRALERKIKFVRRGLKQPKLQSLAAPGDALLQELLDHKDDRHKIVHGAIMGDAEGDAILSLRVIYTAQRHHTSAHRVTAEEVERYATTARDFSDRITGFAVALFNLTRPEQAIDYPLGEFAA